MRMWKQPRQRSRRKWARRGYACADFLAGLIGGAVEHAWNLVCKCALGGGRAISALFRRALHNRAPGTPARSPERVDQQPGPRASFEPLGRANLGVSFQDVAGLEQAKREIRLRMILPVMHPEEAAGYQIRRGGGILLYGPPGTGKTMLAKAVASEISADFYHVSPAEIMTSDVGGAEQNVARLFATIRGSRRAVLFLDEVDALVPRRRNNGSTIMLRVISQILGEVDGLRSTQAPGDLLLIGATNEIEMVDPAMLRPGRFDAKIFVGPPDANARKVLLGNLLEELPLPEDFSLDRLAEHTAGFTGAEIKGFVQQAADEAFLRHIASGQESPLQFDFERDEPAAEAVRFKKRARSGRNNRKQIQGKSAEPSASVLANVIPVHRAAGAATAKTEERTT